LHPVKGIWFPSDMKTLPELEVKKRKKRSVPAVAKLKTRSRGKKTPPITEAMLRKITAERGKRMLERWRAVIRAEIANGITHGVGAGMSIAGLVFLVVLSTKTTALHVVSFTIYGSTLVLLYLASTLYHSLPYPKAKRIFRILDHSAIYLAIAGTYTPFTLIAVKGPWGWSLFGFVWTLALCGVIFKVFFVGRFDLASTIVYILMGWVVLVAWGPVKQAIPTGGLILLFAGGLSYTVGTIFYAWERLPFNHAIWHLFVLGGSICHYLSVVLFILPAK